MRMRGDMASKDDSTEQPVPAVAEARRGEEEEGEGGEGEREGDVCSDQELEDLLNCECSLTPSFLLILHC